VNRAYEKYKEALEELPKIEKQIEQIMKLKRRISIKKVSGLQLLLKANAEEKPKAYNDEEKEIYRGLSMFSPLSFSPFGRSREDVPNTEDTGGVEIPDKIAVGVCDMMLQILTEKRNLFLSRLKAISSSV
jgi:hypothetical protein